MKEEEIERELAAQDSFAPREEAKRVSREVLDAAFEAGQLAERKRITEELREALREIDAY